MTARRSKQAAKPKRSDFPEAMNDGFEPHRVDLKCPRCGSADLAIVEIFEIDNIWEVKNGLVNNEAVIQENPRLTGLRTHCHKCKHGWKPRGASQGWHLYRAVEVDTSDDD